MDRNGTKSGIRTMSARMAAATGAPRGERRCRGYEPRPRAAIDKAAALAPEKGRAG